jgi:ElaB/YqjD/DUF883 family membrane-anchored ribosome-binding protein
MDETPGRVKAEPRPQDDDTNARTREIRHEIDETRSEMTETLDAIQDKLKPRNIVANATDRVKTAATERIREMADTATDSARQAMDYTRETAGGIAGTVRENPLPYALIGIGAAWLIARGARRSTPPRGAGFAEESSAGDYRREYAPSTGDAKRGWPHNIGRMARRRQTQLQRAVQENPLLVGAGAMMLGLACGLAVRETETENEWMGEARDTVVGRAREVARAAANEVQDAAETVADAAKTLSGRAPQR